MYMPGRRRGCGCRCRCGCGCKKKKRNTCVRILDQVVEQMMFLHDKKACTCLGRRRTCVTSRLLSFSTKLHPMCPCFWSLLPHMQHVSNVNSPASANIARRRPNNSHRVNSSPSQGEDLYIATAAQCLRRANIVKMSFLDAHTGFELALERCWSLKI